VSCLLDTKTSLHYSDDTKEFFLVSPWKYPSPHIGLDFKKYTFEPDDIGLIPLPRKLGKLLYGYIRQWNIDEKSIRAYVSGIPVDTHTKFTLSRITNVLWYLGGKFDLGSFECRYISGQARKNHPQNSYICFDVGAVWEKLYRYWDSLLPDIQWHYPEPIFQFFGSQRAFAPQGVRLLMLKHQERILNASKGCNRKLFFNQYTKYVIDLLQLVTLRRPGNAIFGSINNFRKDFSLCYIKDKGNKSERLVPIAPRVRSVLKYYVDFLKTLSEVLYFDERSVSEALRSSLNGEADLFQHWGVNELTPIKIGPYESDFYGFKCHTNWHRHTMLSALFQKGLCIKALPAFADHQPEFDHNFSDISSFEFRELIEISEQINTFLQQWAIPMLKPQL